MDVLVDGRCDAAGEGSARPGGRFAWLPNHEYEVAFKTRVTVGYDRAGELVREVPQTLLFHTKGLPGLNRTERTGEEFAPYVEAAYPGPGRPVYRNEPVALALNEKSDVFRLPDAPHPGDPPERQQQVDWVLVVTRVGGSGPAERISRPDTDWIVAHRGTVPPPVPGRRPVDVNLVASVLQRLASSQDPLWQRFEAVLASPSSCNRPPSTPPSRVLLHRPYDPSRPDAAPALWPARAVFRAGAQIRGGPFVERAPFETGDETALLSTAGAWKVEDGAVGPEADTGGVTSLAIFGDAAWRTCHVSALVDPGGGAAGVATAVSGSPPSALLFVVDAGAGRLRALRRQGAVETELAAAPLPAALQGPFFLEVLAYEDAWDVSVGEAKLTLARDLAESGRLALAVRGAGRVLELRVEPLDVYRFEFLTSRYADFASHVATFPGRIAELPSAAPATSSLAELLAATPLHELMARGSDPQRRQGAFDRWAAALGVTLRRDVHRLELSRRGAPAGTELLLLESPEPLPLSEDVALELVRLESGGVRTPVPLAVLTDGAESRALLVPLSGNGEPGVLAAGDYEITWTIARDRYRAAAVDADSRLSQQAVTSLTL
jgi:hypothetical protein